MLSSSINIFLSLSFLFSIIIFLILLQSVRNLFTLIIFLFLFIINLFLLFRSASSTSINWLNFLLQQIYLFLVIMYNLIWLYRPVHKVHKIIHLIRKWKPINISSLWTIRMAKRNWKKQQKLNNKMSLPIIQLKSSRIVLSDISRATYKAKIILSSIN